jgi:UTP--glucose-1-phosphate uridylyltransferase
VHNDKRISKAVIPAAGFGTRMLPATKAIPKEMLPVAGKPLIQYAVEEAAASGIETVIVVVRANKSLIRAHFARDQELEAYLGERRLSTSIEFIRNLPELADLRFVEQERPLGLAHAITCARSLLGHEPFAVLLPDVIMLHGEPVTGQLMTSRERHGGSVVAVREVDPQDVGRFGIVRTELSTVPPPSSSIPLIGLVEKPAADKTPSRLGVFGRYLLEPAIWSAIAQTSADARGEVQLTDALNLLCETDPLFGFCFEGRHYDAGDRIGYLQANIELSLQSSELRQPLLQHLSGILA